MVSKESQHADRVSAATNPAASPIRARWFSTNILQDWTSSHEKMVCINELGKEMGRGYGGGKKQREMVLSPDRLYPPREMPTASSGAWE